MFINTLFLFILGLVSTFFYKQLYNDGALWAFNILNNGFWHVENNYHRYSTLLLQAPAVISSQFPEQSAFTTWLFCFGYFVYPFISLILCWKLIQKTGREEIISLLYLTLFMVIVPNWAFAVSIVNESIVLFWFLFCYIITRKQPHPAILTLFAVPLLFSYESGAIFFALAIFLLYREKKLTISHFLILTTFILLQAYNLFTNIIPENAHKHFKTSLPYAIQSPFLLFLIPFFLIATMQMLRKKNLTQISIPISILFSVIVVYLISVTNIGLLWGQAYFDRTWAVPVSFIIFLIGYEIMRSLNFKINITMSIFILSVSFSSLYLEFALDKNQIHLTERLQKMLHDNPGCKILNEEEWQNFLKGSYVAVWSFPHMSLLHNKSINPQSMLFTTIKNNEGKYIPNTHCTRNIYGDIEIRDQHGHYIISTSRNINFKDIYAK